MADLLSLDVGVLIAKSRTGGTVQSSESIEKVTKEFNRLRSELVEFDRRVNNLRESIHIEWELLTHMGQSPAFQDDKLAMRIADEVSSRLAVATSESNRDRTRYVREREAAKYVGVTVSTLRSWRTKRSKNGPPYTRLGRMVMYPIAELEEHMKARTVPPRD